MADMQTVVSVLSTARRRVIQVWPFQRVNILFALLPSFEPPALEFAERAAICSSSYRESRNDVYRDSLVRVHSGLKNSRTFRRDSDPCGFVTVGPTTFRAFLVPLVNARQSARDALNPSIKNSCVFASTQDRSADQPGVSRQVYNFAKTENNRCPMFTDSSYRLLHCRQVRRLQSSGRRR